MLYPDTFEQKISFDTIRVRLKGYCLSSLGEEEVDKMGFSTHFQQITYQLNLTNEMLQLLSSESDEMPVGDFFDIRSALSRVQAEGMYLDESEIFDLKRTLEAVQKLVSFISKQKAEIFPNLRLLFQFQQTRCRPIRPVQNW